MPYQRRSSRTAKSNRRKDWGGSLFGGSISANTTQCLYALGPSDLREFFVDPTVVRHQLKFTATINPTVTGYLGVGVIAWDGDPDSNAAPFDCPEVIDDLNADWLIRTVYPLAAGSGNVALFNTLDWETTSSAMRRLGNTRGLLMVVELFDSGTFANFAVQYRYLLME